MTLPAKRYQVFRVIVFANQPRDYMMNSKVFGLLALGAFISISFYNGGSYVSPLFGVNPTVVLFFPLSVFASHFIGLLDFGMPPKSRNIDSLTCQRTAFGYFCAILVYVINLATNITNALDKVFFRDTRTFLRAVFSTRLALPYSIFFSTLGANIYDVLTTAVAFCRTKLTVIWLCLINALKKFVFFPTLVASSIFPVLGFSCLSKAISRTIYGGFFYGYKRLIALWTRLAVHKNTSCRVIRMFCLGTTSHNKRQVLLYHKNITFSLVDRLFLDTGSIPHKGTL